MKAVLSTIAKFHFFDLARELANHSLLERIFTGYPRWKLKNERINPALIDTFPWGQVPYMAANRFGIAPGWRDGAFTNFVHDTFDRHVAANLPECDIFHGLSRYNLRAGMAAKGMGARYICDVGSSHIAYQDHILREEYDLCGIHYAGFHVRDRERELLEYQTADRITLPSEFSVRTFIENGIEREKLSKVPYGVDLSMFRPVAADPDGTFRVLFVGGLTVRKGIRYLAKAFALAKIPRSQLILIGSSVRESDRLLEPVKGMNVIRTGHVPHAELAGWFSKADVTVLPSVEDGYGLVLLQALACGCPIIASTNTGGSECIVEGINGFLVPIRSPEAIAEKILALYERRIDRDAMRSAAVESMRGIGGWKDYGEKMVNVYTQTVLPKERASC